MQSLRKYALFVVLLLFPVCVLLSQEEAQPQELEWLLIMDFAGDGDLETTDKEKAMKIIRSEIDKLKVFRLKDKETASQIVDEKVDEMRGCVETQCSVIIGKFADVPKVLDGVITKNGKGFSVTWSILNVESEQIEFSNSFKIDNADTPDKDMEIPGQRLKAFVLNIPFKEQKPRLPYVWRSAVLPGWGQIYDERTRVGYAFSGSFIVGVAYYYTTLVSFQKAEKNYKSTPFLPASDAQDTYLINSILLSSTRKTYKANETNLNNAAYFLAGVYLWNLVDAFIYSGRQEEKKDKVSIGIFPRRTTALESQNNFKLETYYEINYSFNF